LRHTRKAILYQNMAKNNAYSYIFVKKFPACHRKSANLLKNAIAKIAKSVDLSI